MKRAFVLHGSGLDEAAVHGETLCAELTDAGEIRRRVFTPADFGVRTKYTVEDMRGGSPQENAAITLDILSGGGSPAHSDFLAANLALIFLASRKAQSLEEAIVMARKALRDGAGLRVIEAHRAFAKRNARDAQMLKSA